MHHLLKIQRQFPNFSGAKSKSPVLCQRVYFTSENFANEIVLDKYDMLDKIRQKLKLDFEQPNADKVAIAAEMLHTLNTKNKRQRCVNVSF